jgi:hypothetical protein
MRIGEWEREFKLREGKGVLEQLIAWSEIVERCVRIIWVTPSDENASFKYNWTRFYRDIVVRIRNMMDTPLFKEEWKVALNME